MGVRGEIYSSKVTLPNRTYFFNVKENRMGDLYLNIVESKNRETGGFDRQSVILFADDLQDFLKGFDESLRVMEKAVREKKRGGKAERSEHGERSERGSDRAERGGDKPERGDRPERSERGERSYRSERSERGGKSERAERSEVSFVRGPKSDRPQRSFNRDKPQRGGRTERGDRGQRGERGNPKGSPRGGKRVVVKKRDN